MQLSRARALAILAAAPFAVSCGGGDAVKVGSKNFTEELILGELYAQSLEHAGLRVARKLNLGTTDIAMAALGRGEIDLYPEYTGTALLNVLHLPPESDPKKAYTTVKDAYAQKFALVWLDPAPMNDTQALATTQAVAGRYALGTLSDLAAKANELRLGAVPEFLTRADGLPGLKKRYGGFAFKQIKTVDNGLKYQALEHGDVDVIIAFSTEGQLKADSLVVLEDNKHLFPSYAVAPVVRKALLDAKPDVPKALNALSPLLDNDVMQNLNLQVDGPQKREPADVARDFLKQHGLA
ncbi:MAG: osmoprotectant transport system substrate-binding protein [Candidatus Eremiobacteraeota bacterium]|jgi:osmoprotectant transport system substrate-binding protein|nr:osmoprotectant transport system substrate-binding protein [Candidatus Eremiobacteraeota bacterium]